jgi:hypothetical protein
MGGVSSETPGSGRRRIRSNFPIPTGVVEVRDDNIDEDLVLVVEDVSK